MNNEESDQMNAFDTINHIFAISPQVCLNITPKQLEEGKREESMRDRIDITRNIDEESRERLRKKELQVYTRRRSAPQAPPSDPKPPQQGPPTPTINPPPSPTLPKMSDITLNIDIYNVLVKINVLVPLKEINKIPSMKRKVENLFKVQGEPMDPPIMLQANHFRPQYDENPSLFISLQIKYKLLNSCMLDSRAGENIMSLKVMRKLGLETTRPYKNVCNIESRDISTHGVIDKVKFSLDRYPEIVFLLDIVVIIVLDVWGMLLSRNFVAMLGGTLQMDLTYATIPMVMIFMSTFPN
jgi:hypothetical protein